MLVMVTPCRAAAVRSISIRAGAPHRNQPQTRASRNTRSVNLTDERIFSTSSAAEMRSIGTVFRYWQGIVVVHFGPRC